MYSCDVVIGLSLLSVPLVDRYYCCCVGCLMLGVAVLSWLIDDSGRFAKQEKTRLLL